MAMADAKGWQLGKRIAPPRFLMFLALLAGGLAIAIPRLGWGVGILAAFDVATTVFLLAMTTLLRRGEAAQMREASDANDANRTLLLAVTLLVTLVILVAVGKVVNTRDAGVPPTVAAALVIATLALAWLFSCVIYAVHYAHLYYADGEDGGDRRGLDFPDCDEPDYWDFLYFSVTLGMAFATSDVKINARPFRRIATGQALAAFVFNLGVIAYAIGVLGGQ